MKLKSFEMSMPALERHFAILQRFYGKVAMVNLLGSKEGERLLSNAFQVSFCSCPVIECLNTICRLL